MQRKVKWGIMGSGGIARRRTIPEGFIPARNAHLVSVYGSNPVTNKEVGKEYGTLWAHSEKELLESDIDAVYIASPVAAHREQVLACAAAGKHVLCEKPLGRTVEEANEMVLACERHRVHLGTAFMMRFQTQHQAAADLIRQGRLGQPVYARAQLSCWYPQIPGAWRQSPGSGGGGALIDMGSHCIDLLEMFFGLVKKVSCLINRTVHPYESEDSAVAILQFANGALGSVDTFFCVQDSSSKNALELYGSQGSILATGTIGQASQGKMTAYLQDSEASYQAQQSRNAAGGQPIVPEPRNIYRAEIEAFGAGVLNGTPNESRGELGLRSQRVLAACYDSAKRGCTVDV